MKIINKTIECPKHGVSVVTTIDLISDKIACPHCVEEQRQLQQAQREIEKKKELAKRCGLRYTLFDDWKATCARMQKIKQFVQDYAKKPISNLILCGSTGTGKTMLSYAIATELLGLGVCFIRSSDIHNQARYTWGKSDSCEFELIKYWSRVGLLVIDELGEFDGAINESMARQNRERLSRIIDGRYAKNLPTIITSNLCKQELIACLGDRAWDRLQQNAVFVHCNWESYRKINNRYLEI